jgi:hypothetical protein
MVTRTCRFCNIECESISNLYNHYNSHLTENNPHNFTLKELRIIKEYNNSFLTIQNSINSKSDNKCKICKTYFMTQEQLLYHIKYNHNSNKKQKLAKKNLPKLKLPKLYDFDASPEIINSPELANFTNFADFTELILFPDLHYLPDLPELPDLPDL